MDFLLGFRRPSTNIQKKVARWKYLEKMRETHQENSRLESLRVWTAWMVCITAVVIQQVSARMKVRKRLEWILFLRQRISLVRVSGLEWRTMDVNKK